MTEDLLAVAMESIASGEELSSRTVALWVQQIMTRYVEDAEEAHWLEDNLLEAVVNDAAREGHGPSIQVLQLLGMDRERWYA